MSWLNPLWLSQQLWAGGPPTQSPKPYYLTERLLACVYGARREPARLPAAPPPLLPPQGGRAATPNSRRCAHLLLRCCLRRRRGGPGELEQVLPPALFVGCLQAVPAAGVAGAAGDPQRPRRRAALQPVARLVGAAAGVAGL